MKNCILSNLFFKSKQRSDSEKGENRIDIVAAVVGMDVGVGVDVWSVILLNVDPYWIFKCILVSKEWLEVITSSCFRSKYLKKWKGCFPVIGFMHRRDNDLQDDRIGFLHQEDNDDYQHHRIESMCGWDIIIGQLVAATKLGSHIDKTKLVWGHCRFISKSSSGDGLILCVDDHKKTMYVFNPASSGGSVLVTILPPSPAVFKRPAMEIISFEDASFKVIMMVNKSITEVTTLSIQAFCSSSWTWEMSEVSCSNRFCLSGKSGIGSSRGVVYWPTLKDDVAVYDTNNQQICLISGASLETFISSFSSFYDIVSPGNNLQCAKIDNSKGMISVRWLDEAEEKFEWKLSYTVDTAYVWYNNWPDLILEKGKRDFDQSLVKYFKFVSFVPGKPDSIFLSRGDHVFVYDASAGELRRFQVSNHFKRCIYFYSRTKYWKMFVPLTMAESGVWPSSLSSSRPMSRKKSATSFKPSLLCGH